MAKEPKPVVEQPAEVEPDAPEVVEVEEAPAEKLPDHKDDLVALAIERGVPSYEAWAMTVPELTEKLES